MRVEGGNHSGCLVRSWFSGGVVMDSETGSRRAHASAGAGGGLSMCASVRGGWGRAGRGVGRQSEE